MDPLSIAASAIAIAQAVQAIGSGVHMLQSIARAPAAFSAMLNELSSLQGVLHQLRNAMEDITDPESHIPADAIERISRLHFDMS
ncbi:hypothetical protein B0T22DRAFT_297853 [Podospora appendiculata]|uniref:Fungal N-terminal domain-containing protein n=1 Tax=Podospora appendiculata TaxID=314037 RepID=A0AAE1C8P4_9PEZI|nr:hypothetical protein B0T22DRAFT_297853 [Podospora appendiculata]